jgi:hypothetical protein
MNRWIFCLVSVVVVIACKSKKKTEGDADNSKFFPVVSFLQSQMKDVDTSLYFITKIETEGNRSDTLVIPREDFRKYAKDFLEIPDITTEKYKGDYTETSQYDADLGRASLIYNTTNADAELKRQDVTIMPTFGGNDEVKTIYIHLVKDAGDNTIEKKMYWEVKNYFSVVTITQKENGPEQVKKLQVYWKQ